MGETKKRLYDFIFFHSRFITVKLRQEFKSAESLSFKIFLMEEFFFLFIS